MKKLIFLLLCSVTMFGQVSTGNEAYFDYGIQVNPSALQIPSTVPYVSTFGTDGTQGRVLPQNITIPQIPLNYSVLSPTIGGHFAGIDNKLGSIVATTAGNTVRVWLTADGITVGGNPYYQTQVTKGTAASAILSVVNDDNQKKYFTQDVIGAPYATATLFPPGTYAGNISASTTPNSAQQRWTVELYKCDNSGTPIASGVTGAVVGSLGVTVITILDSGLLTLADGSVTNVQVSGNLGAGGLSMAVGQRIRYHVSAEKVGTAASNITQSVYYGSSYNSFIDVPVPLNTSGVQNLSNVAGGTTTEALNNLNASIPVNYSKIVYVNATNPNAATIFDLNNPPTVNENALKADVANLYIGTDASGWVYNVSTLNYVTKAVTSITSNFYLSGTTTDAGTTKTGAIYRTGNTGFNRASPSAKVDVGGSIAVDSRSTDTSLRPAANIGTLANGEIRGYGLNNAELNTGFLRVSAGGGTNANQKSFIDLSGSSSVPDMDRNIVFGTSGAEVARFLNNGNFGLGTPAPRSKFDVFTGTSVTTYNLASLPSGTISFSNNDVSSAVPTIYAKSSNSTGLSLISGTADSNSNPDFRFVVKETDDTDFSVTTSSAFRFDRANTPLLNILRNGNSTFLGSITGASIIKSGATATDALLAGGGTLPNPVSGTGSAASGQVSFWNGSNSQTGDNSLIWDNTNKRLGVGLANPSSKLSIVGSITVDSGLTNTSTRPAPGVGTMTNGEIRGYNDNIPAGDFGFLRLSAGGGTAGVKSYIDLTGSSTIPDMHACMVFGTAGAESMRINNVRNVGIGVIPTSVSTDKLQVNGNITATSYSGGATLTGTPTAPTASVGTDNTQIANTAFVKANARPYKVYTALLAQTGTASNSVAATVLENTIGAIVWARSLVGTYSATLSGAFTANKTYTTISNGHFTNVASTSIKPINTSVVEVLTFSGATAADGILSVTSVEIRVYP